MEKVVCQLGRKCCFRNGNFKFGCFHQIEKFIPICPTLLIQLQMGMLGFIRIMKLKKSIVSTKDTFVPIREQKNNNCL